MTPQAAPRPIRREPAVVAESRRPLLRLVDESGAEAVARRKRTKALMVVAGLVTVVSIFALASFHAMLLSGQTRLDALNEQVAEERVSYEALRHRVAELESPGRIVTAAQDQLGMVPPEEVTWLVPTVEPQSTPDEVVESADGGRRGGAKPWAAVKPFLGGER